jgi:hypothetical protein
MHGGKELLKGGVGVCSTMLKMLKQQVPGRAERRCPEECEEESGDLKGRRRGSEPVMAAGRNRQRTKKFVGDLKCSLQL